jgi:hypothetical protein
MPAIWVSRRSTGRPASSARCRLPIGSRASVRLAPHQRRDHVGVEDDHRRRCIGAVPNSALRTVSPRMGALAQPDLQVLFEVADDELGHGGC